MVTNTRTQLADIDRLSKSLTKDIKNIDIVPKKTYTHHDDGNWKKEEEVYENM